MLYSCEQRKLFKSRDVEFGEIEGQERVSVDSDSEEEAIDDGLTRIGDPGGVQDGSNIDVDAPTSSKVVDHQVAQRTIPDNPSHPSDPIPLSLCHTA